MIFSMIANQLMMSMAVIPFWVCGSKSAPPKVHYYSATGSSKAEASDAALKICQVSNEDCDLVGCKLVSPERR